MFEEGNSSVACGDLPPLSFRASGVLQIRRRYVSGDGNAEIPTSVVKNSAARNLGQRQTLCSTGIKDQEPFYSGSKGCTRRGFFGRGTHRRFL